MQRNSKSEEPQRRGFAISNTHACGTLALFGFRGGFAFLDIPVNRTLTDAHLLSDCSHAESLGFQKPSLHDLIRYRC